MLRGAILLGLAAGIRPETGPLLLPLWAAGAWMAPVTWRERRVAVGAMAAAVLLWLLPAMFASGGPVQYVKACLDYISDQASVGSGLFGASDSRWQAGQLAVAPHCATDISGLFGASDSRWQTTFWRLSVWVFCGVPAVTMPIVLAWRWRGGWGIGWRRAAFLGVWFLPAFTFALLVHVEDPGQTLAMTPVVSLLCGYLIDHAFTNITTWISRWHTVICILAAFALKWLFESWEAPELVAYVPLVFLAMGLLLKLAEAKYTGFPPRSQILLVLLFPIAVQNLALFNHRGWYYRGSGTAGWQRMVDLAHTDIDSALALTSRQHIETTLALDDHVLREVRRLAAERPGQTVVVWEEGLTAWRKAGYYLPELPIVVLDRKRLRSGSPAVIDLWRGARLESHMQGAAPLRVALPAGGRIVWMLNPASEFCRLVQGGFAAVASGPVWYTDLPAGAESRRLAEYERAW